MKKKIDNNRLEQMLTNIYSSDTQKKFSFDGTCKTVNLDGYVEGRVERKESIRHFSFAKIAAAASACILIISVPIASGVLFSDDKQTLMEQTDISDADITNIADIKEENPQFKYYLDEFENEINNFQYECIKITPPDMINDSEEALQQNIEYAFICSYGIMPLYEKCSFEMTDEGLPTVASDEEFYLYIKECPYTTMIFEEGSAVLNEPIYTRQSYLIWKDENGDITKIRPSAENITEWDIDNRTPFNYQSIRAVKGEINDFLSDKEKVKLANDVQFYAKKDDKLIPVTSGLCFITGYTPDKIVLADCIDSNAADISEMIDEMNRNYWLEEAERYGDFSGELTIREVIKSAAQIEAEKNGVYSFCFADIMKMSYEERKECSEKYSDFISCSEVNSQSGYTICSFCLRKKGYDLSKMKLYGDCDFTMNAKEFYETAKRYGKKCCYMIFSEEDGDYFILESTDESCVQKLPENFDMDNIKHEFVTIEEDNYTLWIAYDENPIWICHNYNDCYGRKKPIAKMFFNSSERKQ